MGRPHSGTVRHSPAGDWPLRDRSRRQRPTPPPPPPPPKIVQDFTGRLPTEATIIRLCRARPAERTDLARRVIDRFMGPNGTHQPDGSTTMETAEAMFLSVIAIRAGMNSRGRNGGDEFVLRTMQSILTSCVTRENARDVATMVQNTRIDHIGGSLNDRRATARPVISRILAHGFRAVVPDVREVSVEDATDEEDAKELLVIATVMRGDPATGWRTVSNMRMPEGTIIPTGMLVLVPYPLPRPAEVGQSSGRHATLVRDERLVLIDASLLPR